MLYVQLWLQNQNKPGTTNMVTPIAKSTPMTQALQMPTVPTVSSSVRDILESSLNEEARATYLDRQIQGMSSVSLPSSMPSWRMAYQLDLKDSLGEFRTIVRKRETTKNMNGRCIG